MDILIPSTPQKYVVTQGMIEDLLFNPAMAAKIFFDISLDAFQSAALKIQWLSYDTEDHSGHGSSKTLRAWILANLSCILFPNCVVGVVYQNAQSGRDNFWKYYSDTRYMTPLFRAQMGRFDKGSHKGRATAKEPGNWKLFFKDGSRVEMPAPGHTGDAEKLGSWEVNRMVIDESNKIRRMGSGIENQLLNRVRLQTPNPNHPVWQNKIWRFGTAETADHPAFPIHQVRIKDEARGDPTLYSFGFCYKDWSNIICPTGKSFRDQIPNWTTIKASNREMTKARRMAEAFGIYALASEGWYGAEGLEAAEEAGRKRMLEPILSRAEDRDANENVHFFAGVDAARSAHKGNDEGAIVVLRVRPRVDDPTDNESDWDMAFVYARLCLNHSAGMWSGAIHECNRAFGFTGILMDPGGSDFITCELKRERQVLNGVETKCIPIVLKNDMDIPSGTVHFILSLTRSADPGMRRLWPDLANARSGGGDTLKHFMNSAFQTAWEKGLIILPPPFKEFSKAGSVDKWPKEKAMASRLLNPKLKNQILSIQTLMDEKGAYKLTSNGAIQFLALGKDDFHDAARNAYVCFRIWLRENEGAYQVKQQDSTMFYGRNLGAMAAALDG